MAVQLSARAVTAISSYEVVTMPLELDSASAILSSVVVDRQHVECFVAEPMPMYGEDFDRWCGFYWPYAYSRAEIRSFERYIICTSLTDVVTG